MEGKKGISGAGTAQAGARRQERAGRAGALGSRELAPRAAVGSWEAFPVEQ